MFIVALGTVVSGCKVQVKAQHSDASGSGFANTTLQTSVHPTSNDQIVLVNVRRPQKRYVRLSIIRSAANSEIDSVVAVAYDAKVAPITDDSTVEDTEFAISPAAS
jgi:hypothetical protein